MTPSPPIPRLLTRFGDVYYAFDKPAGMAVHPAKEAIPDLLSWIKRQRSLPRDLKPGHRLDRATSGVVLCGAGRKARAQIADWFGQGCQKTYLALVVGKPAEADGIIDAPLFDARRKRELECRTRYRVKQVFDGFSLLELELVTGRKHQLRRHLAGVGLPIVGDRRYGSRRPAPVPAYPGRLWLHSWKLSIESRTIEAKLPIVLEEHLGVLTKR